MNKLITDFASSTSAHGWGTIGQRGSKCGKLLWVIFTIACQIAAVVWVAIILTRYLQYKTMDRIKMTNDYQVKFPSVTVCPLNPTPISMLGQWLLDYKKPDSELLKLNDYYALLFKLSGYLVEGIEIVDEEMQSLASKYNQLDSHRGYLENIPYLWKYGHEQNNFIPGCMYKKKTCVNESFERIHHTAFQNCYTYNGATLNDMYVTSQGMEGGLSLIIFLDMGSEGLSLYNPYHSDSGSSGARVIIHEKGTMPDPDNDGFNVEPGLSINVALSVNRRELMKQPWGQCKDEFSLGLGKFKYSKNACRQKCRKDLICEACGCVYETLPMLNVTLARDEVLCGKINTDEWLKNNPNITLLRNDLDRLECLEKYLNYTWREISEEQGCECRENCTTHSYNIETSQALWPIEGSESGFYCRQIMMLTPNYINTTIYERFHERVSDCCSNKTRGKDIGDELRKNFIRLNVYFKDLDTRVIIQDQDFSFWSMLCEVGGILGFFIGVSIISIVEFTLLFLNIFNYVTFKRSKINNHVCSGNDDIDHKRKKTEHSTGLTFYQEHK
ncbi:unnamed protein product [Owenia fusiformis]|uniref:Uncharacterized protein n=1 Tax=Owenia fusiformis TaxID=6347 RepID=A0A8J1UBM3_OWEFU|nr:unnamed protein product [Owenia fusiformis]